MNLYPLDMRALAVAGILSIAVVVYLAKAATPSVGVCALIVAELSPLSLHASLLVTLIYQGLCIILVSAMLGGVDRTFGVMTYAWATFSVLLAAVVSVILAAVLAITNVIGSSIQLVSFIGIALSVILCARLVIQHGALSLSGALED